MNKNESQTAARKFFRNPKLWLVLASVLFALYAYTCITAGKFVSDSTAILGLVCLWMYARVKRNL